MKTPFVVFLNNIFRSEDRDLTGAELGVRFGANAVNILQNTPIEKLYLVDNFPEYLDNSGVMFTRKMQDALYETLLVNLIGYMPQVRVIKKSSEEAMPEFVDESLDFIYIDGAHEYEYIKKDLEWASKVKSGGIIGGHDYDGSSAEVIQAVNEFITANNYRLFVLEPREGDRYGTEWAIIKP